MKALEIKTLFPKCFTEILREWLLTKKEEFEVEIENGFPCGNLRFNNNLYSKGFNVFGLTLYEKFITVDCDWGVNEYDDDIRYLNINDFERDAFVFVGVDLIEHFYNDDLNKIAMTYETFRHAQRYVNQYRNFDMIYDDMNT